MIRYLTNIILVFTTQMLSITLNAQKDVTQFLGIPVDGYKPEMIRKLKDKGFTNTADNKDVLEGEFNGTNVNVHIVTNNNRVCRIMVGDANNISETDIKIRFNKLCQQFQNNKNYIPLPDSTVSKFIISEEEDISYELLVHNKRYEAIFYQKAADYDSLTLEMNNLLKKEQFNDSDKERLGEITAKMIDVKNFKKVVWFMINQYAGKYYITMYYDNEYNRANGEDL